MKLHLGPVPVKLYIDDQPRCIKSVGTPSIFESQLVVMWRAGIADVEVIRTSASNPSATLGRLYHNDIVYLGDVLSINAIPAEGYTVQSYSTEITVGQNNNTFIEIETEQTTPSVGSNQEIVLPTGDMIAISVYSNGGYYQLLFNSDMNLHVLFDGYHWGYNTLDLPYIQSKRLANIDLYDHDGYLDEGYQAIMGSPEVEADYIAAHGRYLGTLIEGDGTHGANGYWYLTYNSELKND